MRVVIDYSDGSYYWREPWPGMGERGYTVVNISRARMLWWRVLSWLNRQQQRQMKKWDNERYEREEKIA